MDQYRVVLGSVDVSFAVSDASIQKARSQRPQARMLLDLARAPSGVVDLAADVRIYDTATEEPVFTGEIVSAIRIGQRIDLTAATGVGLSDEAVSRAANFGMSPLESIRSLLVQAGLAEDGFQLEGLEMPQAEYFEVMSPVEGLTTNVRTHLAGVAFLPGEVVHASPWLADTNLQSDAGRAFTSFNSYVAAGVTAAWVTDAEEAGRGCALDALALLTVDTRCGLATGPDGHRRRYTRSDTRVIPTLADWCMVRSVTSGRGWIRNIASRSLLAPIDVGAMPTHTSLFSGDLPDDLRLAALSIYDAAAGESTLARNLSLWDAVEFYAGTVRPAKLFSRSEAKKLLRQVLEAAEWSDEQRDRLRQARASLNERPLLWRLRHRLVADAVPFTDAEFADLHTLRKSRNDTVHGRRHEGPRDALIRSGVALISRAIIYSAARNGRTKTSELLARTANTPARR